jgi:hypothetical protein
MRMLMAALLFSTACSSAYADQVAPQQVVAVGPRTALAIAPEKTRAPYDVQVITENGETAPTFALKDRFYVQGNLNQRYTIRVTNPTARRVEAVVTVDGLDVVDGEPGDLNKRGYIVPAYSETRIEGFRTSLADVATFRFSSVDNSYAGKKGKARNVGVIAVAIFEETAPPPDQQIVAPQPEPDRSWRDAEARDARPGQNFDARQGEKSDRVATKRRMPAEAREEAPSAAPPVGGTGGRGGGAVASRPMPIPHPPPPPHDDFDEGGDFGGDIAPPTTQTAPRTNRPGLGTEFGEQRYSAASYTKFVRATNRPIAIAELRYNDQAGLMALGIPVAPLPDDGEIMMRETADPFPGGFARPPGR